MGISHNVRAQGWPAFWVALPYGLATIASYLGAHQQAMLSSLEHAHVHLSGFDAALANIPSTIPWILFFAAIISGAIVTTMTLRSKPAAAPTETPSRGHAEVEHERDEALKRIGKLEAQLVDRFPDFHAFIYEIQNEEPVLGPDMHVALVMEVLNNGADSSVRDYKATALTTWGAQIQVEVFSNDGFRLMVNKGRDCFNFLPQHFIMNRTRPGPVKRGCPVTGILPCVFRGITDPKTIDLRTLKVDFADAVGDSEGKTKWWQTDTIESVKWDDPVLKKHRPTLPALEQPCESRGSEPPAGVAPERALALTDHPIFLHMDYVGHRFRIFNDGKAYIKLWGTQMGSSSLVLEREPRWVSPGPSTHYYILGNTFEQEVRQKVQKGKSGRDTMKVFLTNDLDEKYVATFAFGVSVPLQGDIAVNVSLINLEKRDWI